MKSTLTVILTILFLLSPFKASADTEYVTLNAKDKTDAGWWEMGPVWAKRLTRWEKEHPDSKIVSIAPYAVPSYGGGTSAGQVIGFWVTYEQKPEKPEKSK